LDPEPLFFFPMDSKAIEVTMSEQFFSLQFDNGFWIMFQSPPVIGLDDKDNEPLWFNSPRLGKHVGDLVANSCMGLNVTRNYLELRYKDFKVMLLNPDNAWPELALLELTSDMLVGAHRRNTKLLAGPTRYPAAFFPLKRGEKYKYQEAMEAWGSKEIP
jgi:hypothetical protein